MDWTFDYTGHDEEMRRAGRLDSPCLECGAAPGQLCSGQLDGSTDGVIFPIHGRTHGGRGRPGATSSRRGQLYEDIRAAGWTGWHPDDYDPTDEDLERVIDVATARVEARLAEALDMLREIEAGEALSAEVGDYTPLGTQGHEKLRALLARLG